MECHEHGQLELLLIPLSKHHHRALHYAPKARGAKEKYLCSSSSLNVSPRNTDIVQVAAITTCTVRLVITYIQP